MAAVLKSFGLVSGDKVVLQGYTCIAVPQGISALGMVPLVVDTDKNSLFMSPYLLEDTLKNNDVKCVIIQHTFGYLAPESLYDICNKYHVKIIDDCAHLFPGFNSFVKADYLTSNRFYSMEWGKPVPVGIGGFLESENPIISLENMRYDIVKIIKIELQYLGFLLFYRPFFFFKIKKLFSFLIKLGLFEGNNMNIKEFDMSNEEMYIHISPLVKKRYLKELKRKKILFDKKYNEFRKIIELLHSELPSKISKFNLDNSIPMRFPVWVNDKKEVLKRASELNIPLGDWYSTTVDPLSIDEVKELGWTSSNLENSRNLSEHIVTIPLDKYQNKKSLKRIIVFLKKHVNLNI
jgi:perosamine synthetase